jgi:hypothetical protein
MADAEEGANSTDPAEQPRPKWWKGKLDYIKRKAQEHGTKKDDKNPEIKAATSMARATWWIVSLTFCLVIIAWFQYQEIQDSGDIMDRMNRIYRTQTGELSRQAGETKELAERTKDLADRMKDQADQTKIIANQAVVQANAADSAAKTANKALHISERAYVVAGQPTIDTGIKYITLPIVNNGHMPSGKVRAIIHEVTIDGIDPAAVHSVRYPPTEVHWRHYELESVPTTPTQIMGFTVFIPALNADSLNSGREQVIIVGVITYSDGFPDDTEQQWPFCYGSAMLAQSKNLQWAVCDSNLYLPQAINEDHYPNNEYDR